MAETVVKVLYKFGQSIWLDFISRSLIQSGQLKELIKIGITGLTSNPTIFNNAIKTGSEYNEDIRSLSRMNKSAFEIYDELTIKDIQDAADLFRPIYEQTNGRDGYVSLEVNPHLAFDAEKTIQEAHRLHSKVARPNVMFKIPATDEGFKAIQSLISDGININVTLIFSVEQYTRSAYAFINGIKEYKDKKTKSIWPTSVSSVFVSRIDTAVDNILDELISKETYHIKITKLTSLKGKTAVANSALIYKRYCEIFESEDFLTLKREGARQQRLLWGSTSTKNPAYSDIKYVTELIAKDTINTMPQKTLEAFLDNGVVKEALVRDTKFAEEIIYQLKDLDIEIDEICRRLLEEGIKAFIKPFDELLLTIENKIKMTKDDVLRT